MNPHADSSIQHVTEANFDSVVQNSALPVLLDFWAPWCAPCLALSPTLDALAQMYAGRLVVAKINCDDAPALQERFGARGIPHLILTQGGKETAVLRARTRTRLAMELEALLGVEGQA